MKISGFENIIAIEEFEYINKLNEHERCAFVCYVKEKDIDTLMNLVGSDCEYEHEQFFFLGHIVEVIVSKDISGVRIEVNSIGKTHLYDIDKHYRIFQSSDKTLSDILSKLESMSEVKHKTEQEEPIQEMLIQENLSDWEFAVYLAKTCGEYIFPSDKTFVGSHNSNEFTLEEKDLIDYKYISNINGIELVCRINKNINLGDIVIYSGKKLFVSQKKYILEQEQYYYEYYLLEIKEHNRSKICNNAFLEAIVKDNNDPDRLGRIKVSFENEGIEDCMQEDAVWLERECFYSSEGFGAVFIPAIQDKVIVKVSDGKGVVLGSLRTEPYDEVFQNQDSKYILIDKDIFMEYTNGSFNIVNKDIKLSLLDKKITLNIGDDTGLVIDSDSMNIQISKSVLEFSNDWKVSTSNYFVEAKRDTSILANNINIKGKSGVNIN